MLAPFTHILWFLVLAHLLFVSSPEPKAQSDILVCQWSDVILFIEVDISKVSWPILIKFLVKHNQVAERLHKVFRLIGLELWLPWQHIYYSKFDRDHVFNAT